MALLRSGANLGTVLHQEQVTPRAASSRLVRETKEAKSVVMRKRNWRGKREEVEERERSGEGERRGSVREWSERGVRSAREGGGRERRGEE